MVSMRRHRKAKFPKEFHAPQKMKIIRVDYHTQIEVPENMPDDVAIERFNLRRRAGQRIGNVPSEVLKEAKEEGIEPVIDVIPSEDSPLIEEEDD